MKNIKQYIQEKLIINKHSKLKHIYHPKDWKELRNIIEERLAKDKDANLNDIDISQISLMINNNNIGIFENLDPHNIKIDKWDMSNVKSTFNMFNGCNYFNCDLSKWDVSNVINMSMMFEGCGSFKGEGLENWKPLNCKFMTDIFNRCYSLKNKPSWYK